MAKAEGAEGGKEGFNRDIYSWCSAEGEAEGWRGHAGS